MDGKKKGRVRRAADDAAKFAKDEGQKIVEDTVVDTYRRNMGFVERSFRAIVRTSRFILAAIFVLLFALIVLVIQFIIT